MRIELEPAWYLDRVYRMADSISEGSSSVNKGPSSTNEGLSSFTRSVFDASGWACMQTVGTRRLRLRSDCIAITVGS